MDIETIRTSVTYKVPLPRGGERLRELIIYVSEKCALDQFFGSVKLNKVLFHSDFRSFKRYGVPVTGTKYRKYEHGPAPVEHKPLERDMIARGDIVIRPEVVFGLTQHRVVPLRQADLTLFTGRDIAVVDQVIQDLWAKTATQVSAESHGVQWMTRNLRDDIPYEAAYLSNEPLTPYDIERTAELAARFGWPAA
jgi:hypothetical protein